MVVTKKQHKFGAATEESVFPPKTNGKNGIGTMNFISVSPSPPLCIPSFPTHRAEKGHAGTLQTFTLWRWGGNGLAVRQNEGAIGLTHRSCFRVAAAPTLATRGATIHRIIFDDLLFLKARRQGRGEGRTSSGTGCTCCGNEKRGPLSMFLTLSVRGGTRTT